MSNCGIYKITNVVTGIAYYGSSKNISKRWKGHYNSLKKGIHHNIILQRAFKKYGEENFIFNIVELCEEKELLIKEQYYLDNISNIYNIASAKGGDNFTNNPNKEIIRNKMSNSLNKRYKNLGKDKRKELYGKSLEKNGNWKGGKTINNCIKCNKKIHIRNKFCHKCLNKTKENNPFFGKQHTEETKQKFRMTILKRKFKSLGFEYILCPYKKIYIWQHLKDSLLEFNPENMLCSYYAGEFSMYSRKCETGNEIKKFIECIKFLIVNSKL